MRRSNANPKPKIPKRLRKEKSIEGIDFKNSAMRVSVETVTNIAAIKPTRPNRCENIL